MSHEERTNTGTGYQSTTEALNIEAGTARAPFEEPSEAGKSAEGKSAEQLERDIEQTRARMSRDIDEIGERLRPGNLAQSAVNSVGEQARRTGSRLADFLRDNAVPVAAIGFGVTWLAAERRSRRGLREISGDRMARYAYGGPERRISRYPERRGLGARLGETAGGVRERVSGAASGLADRASDLTERAGDVAGRAQERAGELGTHAKERVQELGAQAREQTQRVRSGFERTLEGNPLAVAAGAAVLGLAVGLLLPSTRRENEVMGPVRDQLAERAGETVERVTDAATEAAREVKETVKAEVSERAPEVKGVVQEAAQRVADQAKESAGRVKDESKDAVKAQGSRKGKGPAREEPGPQG